MSNLDVALRIKLLANTGSGRKRVIDDLRGIQQAANGLGKQGGADKLKTGLDGVEKKARTAKRAVDTVADSAAKLKRADPATGVAKGLDNVERRARRTRKAVNGVADSAAKLKNVDPSTGIVKGFDEIEKKARRTRDRVRSVARAGSASDGQVRQTGSAFDFLAGGATRAMGAMAAFVAPAMIIRGLSEIEAKITAVQRGYASIAVTDEKRDPAYVAKMLAIDTEIGKRYGLRPDAVQPIRNDYAAAGLGPEAVDQIMNPSARAVKAMDADPRNISQAVISGIQNLGITPDQIPQYLDMIAKGTKLGRFESDSVAKFMPMFASSYASLGFTGLDAAAEINAMAQVVRTTSSTPDAAGTNLQNYLVKLTAPDSVKNFKEKGVDIQAIMAKSQKDGSSFVADALAKTWEITKGDTFAIGELFGDMQAKAALEPLLRQRKLLEDWKKLIRDQSTGTLEEDWDFLRRTPAERQARLEAVAGQGQDKAGQKSQPFVNAWKWLKAEFFNPGEAARQDRLDTYTPEQTGSLEGRIQKLEAERSQILGQMEATSQPDPLTGMVGGLGGGEPLGPLQFRLGSVNDELEQLKGDLEALRATGEAAGNALNDGLKATAPQAIDTMQGIVDKLKSQGNIVISPTVVPHMGAPIPGGGGVNIAPSSMLPSGGATPASKTVKRSASLGGQTNHFHIASSDPKGAANEVERRLGRLGDSSRLLSDTV